MSADRLTFLLDCDDLADVERQRPDALRDALVAVDIDVHLRLLERGAPHLTPWEIVRRDEYAALAAFDRAVLDFWDAHARVEHCGLDCLRAARYRHMCCFTRLAWAAWLIRRTLGTLRPRRVVTFNETAGHGLDQPARCRKMPLFFGLVRGAAEQAGIEVDLLERPPAARFQDYVAAASEVRLPPADLSSLDSAAGFVLFAGSGLDLLRQAPVIRELRDRGMARPVQIYKSADEAVLAPLRAEGHTVWHESQIAGGNGRSELEMRSEAARRRFEACRGAAPDMLRPIFANPWLDTHFNFIFGDYFVRVARQVETWTRFFGDYRPRAVVVNYPSPVVDVAHALGIPCLALSHGAMILGDLRLYRGQPRIDMGAVSEAHRERLVADGFEPARVHVTGDPGLAGSSTATDGKADSRAGCPPHGKRVLLVTGELSAPSAKACLPEVDFRAAVRTFDELGELIERRREWQFTIKCHPRYDHPAIYRRLNDRLPPDRRVPVLTDEPLDRIVHESDAVVFPNNRSSAVLEASRFDKPVLLLDTCMIWFDHALWGTDRWPRVGSVHALEGELLAAFADPACYSTLAEATRRAAAYCVGETEGAARRCARWISAQI